jgi:colanic acid/amylovoran biosynthesis glycosyltransferase
MSASDPAKPVVAIFRAPLFNPSEGFVQAQAAGLVRYEPLLVGLEDKGHVRPELAGGRLIASRADSLAIKLLGRPGSLAARLRPYSPVLVHAHFATDGLLALPLARSLGIPLVTTLHGHDVSRSRAHMLGSGRLSWIRYALLRRRLIASGDLFLAVSDALRQRALAQGYPESRTVTHYLGVDLRRFRADPAPEPGLILHVGRLVEKKGTFLLLAAFARVRESNPAARLVIVGDGAERRALEAQCSALALGDSVRFLGALAPAGVAGWMRRAVLLAVPSVTGRDGDSEGLPTVLMEAAAAALPAIGSRHSGIPEAIHDGETGFLVAEGDSEALADRILALLGSVELQRRMGVAARKLAESRFDLVRQNARLEEIYDGIRGRIRA